MRRGFLFAYKSYLKISDIHKITIKSFEKGGSYYVIVDPNHSSFCIFSKNAYFMFDKTENNLCFIRSFWQGEIE